VYQLRETRGKNLNNAYIAGFIDGEGYIGFELREHNGVRSYLHPRIIISNSDKKVLEWIQSQYGGYIAQRQEKPNWKIAYKLRFNGRETINLLLSTYKFLRVKKGQALLMLHALTNRQKNLKNFGGFLDKGELERREQWYMQMKQMNKRGSPAETK
jgi:hypothetical protein